MTDRLSWTSPICEVCWLATEGTWAADDTLISVRTPVTVMEPRLEQCAWCGAPTIVGIYKRADPTTVPFPAHNDEERSN